jgi:hypothetical protein
MKKESGDDIRHPSVIFEVHIFYSLRRWHCRYLLVLTAVFYGRVCSSIATPKAAMPPNSVQMKLMMQIAGFVRMLLNGTEKPVHIHPKTETIAQKITTTRIANPNEVIIFFILIE